MRAGEKMTENMVYYICSTVGVCAFFLSVALVLAVLAYKGEVTL